MENLPQKGLLFEVWNFQAYEYVQVYLDGFTIFTGESNHGKSAIAYKALSSLLYNYWEPKYLRTGAKQCVMKLTFLDPTTKVEYLQLAKPINSYIIEYREIGRAHV